MSYIEPLLNQTSLVPRSGLLQWAGPGSRRRAGNQTREPETEGQYLDAAADGHLPLQRPGLQSR
jgi:hypothetical protein